MSYPAVPRAECQWPSVGLEPQKAGDGIELQRVDERQNDTNIDHDPCRLQPALVLPQGDCRIPRENQERNSRHHHCNGVVG